MSITIEQKYNKSHSSLEAVAISQPFFVNMLVRAVARDEKLKNIFMNIAVENRNLAKGFAPNVIAKVIVEGMTGK